MSNPKIEIDIAEILKEMKDNQTRILDKVNNIDSRLIKVETKLDSELPTIKENIKDFKESQKTLITDVADLKGFKSLIIPTIVAVIASAITLGFKLIFLNKE